MSKYSKLISAPVPQTERLNNRQILNNAQGFVFQIDDWSRLERFLIIGSDAPTYYQSAKILTRENAQCVERCYASNPGRTVDTIIDISESGRAAKNDAAIFALAMGAAHDNASARKYALGALPQVCRTGTHLFQFTDYVRALGRGWGRGLKRAVANWYDQKPVDKLGYQVIKYRQREGYSHKRLLQTSHPTGGSNDISREALYQWICDKEVDPRNLPTQVAAHIYVAGSTDKKDWVEVVKRYDLPWEALPTEANACPEVWQALLPKMGMTALIRNLGNMSRLGVISPLSKWEKIAVERIRDEDELKKARIHPFNVLQATKVYGQGRGFRGTNTWEISQPVVAALNDAFYKSFNYVEPANKRNLIGLDVSSSMSSHLNGSALSVAEGAAAMLMTSVRTEPYTHVIGFSHVVKNLGITASDSLETVLKKTRDNNFGSTNCSLPMVYALQNGIEVDTFQVYTDNETYAGRVHPVQALRDYRNKTGIPAKLVVCGMTSTGFSIADPQDGGMLDVVGFDSSAPGVIADFSRR